MKKVLIYDSTDEVSLQLQGDVYGDGSDGAQIVVTARGDTKADAIADARSILRSCAKEIERMEKEIAAL